MLQRIRYWLSERFFLDRHQLKETLPAESVFPYGPEGHVHLSSPVTVDGVLPAIMQDYTGRQECEQCFVCDVQSAKLVGPWSAGITSSGKVISEMTPSRTLYADYRLLLSYLGSLFTKKHTKTVVCSLAQRRARTYFHWFRDQLPRLQGVEEYERRTGKTVEILLPENPQKWLLQSIELMGYKDRCTVWSGKSVSVEHLILPTVARYKKRPPERFSFTPESAAFLVDRISSHLPPKVQSQRFAKKVYISRRNATWRRVQNEEEVMNALRPLGFELFVPDEMTVAEQVQLFKGAEWIISLHGSNLTNILFCEEGAKVIEFFTKGWERLDYWNIASARGLTYGCMTQDHIPGTKHDCNINTDTLLSLMKKMEA